MTRERTIEAPVKNDVYFGMWLSALLASLLGVGLLVWELTEYNWDSKPSSSAKALPELPKLQFNAAAPMANAMPEPANVNDKPTNLANGKATDTDPRAEKNNKEPQALPTLPAPPAVAQKQEQEKQDKQDIKPDLKSDVKPSPTPVTAPTPPASQGPVPGFELPRRR